MTNSRAKGANFERTIAQELYLQTGVNFKRDLDQYRERDRGDLLPDNDNWPFVIECKKRATGREPHAAWEVQVFKAAETVGKFPALVYQVNRQPVRCRIWADGMAAAFGSPVISGRWFETDLHGLAWVAGEIMARAAE